MDKCYTLTICCSPKQNKIRRKKNHHSSETEQKILAFFYNNRQAFLLFMYAQVVFFLAKDNWLIWAQGQPTQIIGDLRELWRISSQLSPTVVGIHARFWMKLHRQFWLWKCEMVGIHARLNEIIQLLTQYLSDGPVKVKVWKSERALADPLPAEPHCGGNPC